MQFAALAQQSNGGRIAEQALQGSGYRPLWDSSIALQDEELTILAVRVNSRQVALRFVFEQGALSRGTLLHVFGESQYPVCHVPPGNPSAAHTSIVDIPAIRAHMVHGDSVGYCANDTSSPQVKLALVDLTEGTTMIDLFGPNGDAVVSNGPWLGTATLDELTTPIPQELVPAWFEDAARTIAYTGPIPEPRHTYTSAISVAGNEEDLDDGNGGGGGGNPGTGGDGTGDPNENNDPDPESEEPVCNMFEMNDLHTHNLIALDNWKDAKKDVEDANENSAKMRRDGLQEMLFGAGASAEFGGVGGAAQGFFGAAIPAVRAENNAIDELAAAREACEQAFNTLQDRTTKRQMYYLSHACSDEVQGAS